MDQKNLVLSLLEWFGQNARDLPWRLTRDPYAIWISEVMLQQTQVQTVIPYWERWMRTLPTLQALAKARPEKIHKLWEGLGYYTRVRNLHRAAREMVARHQGTVPSSLEELLALPGIGRYTAGAICSIAFNQPTPIVDGNVIRVLARVFGKVGNPRVAAVRNEFWELARCLVLEAAQSEMDQACSHFNQALMELGAIVCTPREPRCGLCPIRGFCLARRQGRQNELPTVAPRPRITKRRFMAFVVEFRGKLLVRQRPDGVVNGHLWEFPNAEVGQRGQAPENVARALFGVPMIVQTPLGSIRHSITRYRMTLEAFTATPVLELPRKKGVWVNRQVVKHLTFSSAHRKLLEKLLSSCRSAPVRQRRIPGIPKPVAESNVAAGLSPSE